MSRCIIVMDERQVGKQIVRSELLTLKTLADVRDFIGHIPAHRRKMETWQTVVRHLKAAASGGSIEQCVVSLRMVLMLVERVDVR